MAQVNGNAVAPAKPTPMSEGELKGILNAKLVNSLGYYGGKLSKERTTALQYYNGEKFGNEQEGRSQVVSRDVAEAIDSMMPSLVKIFTAGEEVVRFDPTRPQDEKVAQQATDYINWIWNQQNEGFHNTFTWFKDALLTRTAAIKIWWDEQEETNKETYKGLTDGEFALLMQDTGEEKLELLEHDEYPDQNALIQQIAAAASSPPALPGAAAPPSAPPAPIAAPQQAGAVPVPSAGPAPMPMLHDVVLRRTNKTGRIRIIPIPGEEFLMDRRAVSLEDTPFVCHRVKKTVSDLVEMGYSWDEVKDLAEGDSSDFNLERLERFRQEDELPYRTGNNYDPSMREVWVNEAYIKVDFDGDGIAELRKVLFAGEAGNFAPGATVILENEEVDDHPFAALTPTPMPHKFFGMSVADQTMDIQLIKSTLWRQALDNMYNANAPPLGVVEGQVNLDDLLSRKVGGVVRMQRPDSIFEIPNPQLGSAPFEMIGYLDQVREQRTGVQRFVAGPGSDVLNNAYTETATGANLVENSSQERIELIARCFAEIGMKPAFRKILKLVSMHQNKPQTIRLRGKWVDMDPREWDTEFDMTVTVGLGTGNRQQQMQGMQFLLTIDQQIIGMQKGIAGPLVTAENLYNKLDKLCQYMGLKSADSFYTDPATMPMPQQPQQPPDPMMAKAQLDAQVQQMQMQADREKINLQEQADMQRTQMQIASQERIAKAKIAVEREVEYARIAADRQEFREQSLLKLHEIHQRAASDMLRMQPGVSEPRAGS